MDTNAPEFRLAWAKILARAATDTAFRTRLSEDPVAVFADYGYGGGDKEGLSAFLASNLRPALDALSQQRAAQDQAARAAAGAVSYTTGCGGDPGMCATQACRLPCWAAPSLQAGGAAGGISTAGGFGAYADQGARFNCWGCAACIGSAGSYCGTAGTVGTGGTFGCGGGAQAMSSTPLSGAAGGMASTGGTDAGARFNCVGSVGTAGSVGSWCGTAGSAATVGTFGCALQSQQAAAGAATAMGGGTAAGALGGTGADMGARFNCWGSAACIGSAGSYCGTAGTVGTGGTFGCGGGAQMSSTQLSGAAGGMANTGATESGARFNCVGSIGTAGCLGSYCGTAGSAATVGTFGCAVQSQPQTPNAANSGATLGSFATYCGCVGGGMQATPMSTCWGTAGGF